MPQDEISSFIFRNPVSAGTHLLWCLLALYVTGLLWRLSRGDRLRQLSTGAFGVSMVLLYGASGVYHAVPQDNPFLSYFRKLDHSAIYVLIAGTYTPVFAVLLRGSLRVTLLSLVWGLAVIGIAAKWLLPWPPYALTVSLYIAIGWVGLIPAAQLIRAVGLHGMFWGLLGGILYTMGGVCDAIKWPPVLPGVIGPHEVLHVFDMGGTLIHIFFIIRYVLPFRR
ncbi:MAG TPA: hemolysin III family protein [Gemmataceae bacterium]|nr:hemolysin III family protein [Gemmataceae bacterium]